MRIFWTKKFQFRFQEINTYISTEFGEKSSSKFRNKVFDFLELLQRFPELGTLEVAEKNIRGFHISK
ncbi:type II toxin-antitoxin system RelE/ParE family toxin [Ekhidna sp.]